MRRRSPEASGEEDDEYEKADDDEGGVQRHCSRLRRLVPVKGGRRAQRPTVLLAVRGQAHLTPCTELLRQVAGGGRGAEGRG